MTGRNTTPVAIIGAGPVGMNLALFLQRLDVKSVVFDPEKTSRWHPKGSTHNSRTMEHYRWLGLSDVVRSTGLPADFPQDIAYFTSGLSWELARFRLPSERERAAAESLTPALHQVPEPLLRSNQMYVERCLREQMLSRPGIETLFGWEVVSLAEDQDGVTVTAASKEDGRTRQWRASYVVGCDGANSFTRRFLQIAYEGRGPTDNTFLNGAMVSSYIRMPTFEPLTVRGKKAWMYNIVSPRSRLIIISLNGSDEYLVMFKGATPGHLPADTEVVEAVQAAVGQNVPVSVMRSLPWSGGIALIADRFARGRVVLCGDSCHLFSPTGGYGMNTGIDDARNLSWKLAACLQGWAPPELLATYEIERKPIARRNTRAALSLSQRAGRVVAPANLEEPSEESAAARQSFGEVLAVLRTQFTSLGVELGARYDGSPIVWDDGLYPLDTWEEYHPSSVPGGRLPHMWLSDRTRPADPSRRASVFDALGLGFTLVRVGAEAPRADEFLSAARKLGVPFSVLDLPRTPAIDLYERELLMVRPDHHVAWRADHIDQPPEAILKQCLGWDVQSKFSALR